MTILHSIEVKGSDLVALSLEEVSDRLLIADLYARYVHHADTSNIKGLDEVFEPKAVLDYSAAGAAVTTWDQARDTPLIRGELFWRVHHIYTNFLIVFDKGSDAAKVAMKVFCPAATAPGEQGVVTEMLGTYDDEVVKDDQGWRIRHRHWNPWWISQGQTVQPELNFDL